MKRYIPPKRRDRIDEAELAKARLRVAAIQAGPAEIVRKHPWASVIGTFAAAVAAAGLFGGNDAPRGESRGESPRAARDGARAAAAASKRADRPGFSLPPGLLQWVLGMGVQLFQAYMSQHTIKRAAEEGNREANRDNADVSQENGHAVG